MSLPASVPSEVEKQPYQLSLHGVIGPSMVMTGLSLANLMFTLVYQLLVARQFGAKSAMDAYLAAMAIPNWFVAVSLTSLNFTLIPVFVEHLAKGSEAEAWKTAITVIKLVFGLTVLLWALGTIMAPQLVAILTPGFKDETFHLAVSLLRILLPSLVFSATFGMLSSVHYALKSFILPSLAPILYVLVNLAVLFALARSWGIASVALGTVLGQAVQVAVLAPILMRSGRWLFYFGPRHPEIARLLKLMAPLVAVGAVSKSTEIIERFFASRLPEGSLSYLGYALRIINPISSILITGVVVTVFTLMAQHAAAADRDGGAQLKMVIWQAVNLVLFIMLPVAGWLAVVRVPLVAALLERGQFSHEATLGTANALLYYLGFFILAAVGNILSRAFYVLKDTRTPAVVGLGVVFYVLLSAALVNLLSFIGLALSLSIYFFGSAVALVVLLDRKLKGFEWKAIVPAQLKIAAASVVSACCASIGLSLVSSTHGGLLLALVASTTLGVIGYLATAWALRTDELRHLLKFLEMKLRNQAGDAGVAMNE